MDPVRDTLRRWFPEATIRKERNWLVFARIDERHQVTVLFDGDEPYAVWERHLRADGQWCGGHAPIRRIEKRPDDAVWTVQQESPLTLHPSIQCRSCGEHGYIREGRWVAA